MTSPYLSTDASRNGARPLALVGARAFQGDAPVPGTGGVLGDQMAGDAYIASPELQAVTGPSTFTVTDESLVRVDPSGGSVTVQMPAEPWDGMRVSVRVVAPPTGSDFVAVSPAANQGVEIIHAPGGYALSSPGVAIADAASDTPTALRTVHYVFRQTGALGVGRWDLLATRSPARLGLVYSYDGTLSAAGPASPWAAGYTVGSSSFTDITGATGLLAKAGITPAIALAGDVIDVMVSLTASITVGSARDYVGIAIGWNPNSAGTSRLTGTDLWGRAPATSFDLFPLTLLGRILVGSGQVGPWDVSLQAALGFNLASQTLDLTGGAKIMARMYRAA